MAQSQMTPRPARFLDGNFQAVSSNLNIRELVSATLANFSELFEQEQSGDPIYKECWQEAEAKYEAIFESLNKKDKNFLTKDLAAKLPEQLQGNEKLVVVAVIANCMEDSRLAESFLESTKSLHSGNTQWENFGLKTFMALLILAQEHLPSRPGPELKRLIFRGLDSDTALVVGQTFSLGYFASFTKKRALALGHQPKVKNTATAEDDEADDVEFPEDDEEENYEEDGEAAADSPKPPKMLLRVLFNGELKAIGLRHLSPYGGKEIEVLVSPDQKFQVKKIIVRKKKGFSVFVVQPVE